MDMQSYAKNFYYYTYSQKQPDHLHSLAYQTQCPQNFRNQGWSQLKQINRMQQGLLPINNYYKLITQLSFPSLSSSDSYVHFVCLQRLSKENHYPHINLKPPPLLIRYLIQLLSLEACPFSLSILEYFALNIPHFCYQIATHQLQYFIGLLEQRYPVFICYSHQYKKLCELDKSQSKNMLRLLEILCVIYSKIEQNQRDKTQQVCHKGLKKYFISLVNYLLVSIRFVKDSEKGQMKLENIEKEALDLSIKNSLTQVVEIGKNCWQTFQDDETTNKLMQLTYLLTPNKNIKNKSLEMNMVGQIVGMLQTSKEKNNKNDLFQFFKQFLLNDLKFFGFELSRRSSLSSSDHEKANEYHSYCWKIINLMQMGIWSKREKNEFVHIIYSFKVIAGVVKMEGFADLIEYAIQVGKSKMKCTQNFICPKEQDW